jgi:GMP synthase-like glutamine amidotransferase
MDPWLIIRNTGLEGPDLLADVLARERVPHRVVDAFDGTPLPARPTGIGGLAVLGGPMGVYEADAYPFLAAERHLLRATVERGLPVLGICLGAQLLASAFGARVYPGPVKEIGWAPITITPAGRDDPVLTPLANAPFVFHLHGDTFDLPEGAIHLATSARYARQAFRIGARAYGLQFHLEFGAQTITGIAADAECAADARSVGIDPVRMAIDTVELAAALRPHAEEVFRRLIRSGGRATRRRSRTTNRSRSK